MELTWISTPLKKIQLYGSLVMFSHTIFSFSFAIVSILLATRGAIVIDKYLLAFLALFFARTGANAINRVIDVKFDSLNYRTKNRDIPSGRVSIKEAKILSAVCFAIMVVCSFLLNPLCALLSPVALFLMLTYSYTKRFTYFCHLYLGFCCAVAPMGAYIAITGKFFDSIIPFLLAFANMFWVAGFDTIYGSQDYDFDIKNGLNSLSTKFGVNKALKLAFAMHILALISLVLLFFIVDLFSVIYLLGIIIIFILLMIEHNIVTPTNMKKISIASYSINQLVGIIFMFFSVVDIYL